jgi:hypothetical protein
LARLKTTPKQGTDLNRKFGLLRPLRSWRSKLSLDESKPYETILLPTLTYAMEVWGSAKTSNIVRVQRFQS